MPTTPEKSSSGRSGFEMRKSMDDYVFGKRIADERGKGTSAFKAPRSATPPAGVPLPHPKLQTVTEYTTPVPSTIGKDTPAISFGPKKHQPRLDRGEYLRTTQGAISEYTTPVYSSFNVAKPRRKSPSISAASPDGGSRLKDQQPHSVTTEYTTPVPSTIGKDTPAISFGPKKHQPRLDRGEYLRTTQGAISEYTTPVYSSFNVAKPLPKRLQRPHTAGAAAGGGSRLDFAKKPSVAVTTEFTTSVQSSFKVAAEPPARKRTRCTERKRTDEWLGVPKADAPGPGYYFVP